MGLAALSMLGPGLSMGFMFAKLFESIARQPEAEAKLTKVMWIGLALVEAIALYGLVIAFMILGKIPSQ